jgi:translation initiation factor 3 subunit D
MASLAGLTIAALPVSRNGAGWGPTQFPEEFVGIPYEDFNKGARLGRVADFTAQQQRWLAQKAARNGGNSGNNNGNNNGNNGSNGRGGEAKGEKFDLVDTTKQKKQQRLGNRRGGGRNRQGWRQQKAREERTKKARSDGQDRKNRRYLKLVRARRGTYRRWGWQADRKEASVSVKSTWKIAAEFETGHFEKLRANRPTVTDLMDCGELRYYDEAYDRVNIKRAKRLKRFEAKDFYSETALNDPIIEQLAQDPATGAQIYTTDAVVTHLMCCARAQVPWDIKATRVGGMVFLDKRSGSHIDLLTVSETARDPPTNDDKDSINSAFKLSIECSQINQNFSQQVLSQTKAAEAMPNPHPFHDPEEAEEGHTPASVCYRYRKFDMGGTMKMICRTELHGLLNKKGKKLSFTTCALNEWDSKEAKTPPWKAKLTRQPGGVLATELKNNSMKLAKWTLSSFLAGADLMKIGFVKRKSPKDPANHEIVHQMMYEPQKFALQINLSIDNAWGVLKMIAETLLAQPDGMYSILKDPNKDMVRVYSVPEDEFDSSDDDSEDDDSEDDDSDDDDDEAE